MKRLDLIRLAYFPFGVFGKFLCGSNWLVTVERPWLANAKSISCIAEGTYICKPRYFNRGNYQAVEVTNVKDRADILFHIANWPSDVEGCIGIGKKISCLARNTGTMELAVSSSSEAFKEFMTYYGFEEFELHVRQVEGAKI